MYSCGPTVYGPPHIGNLRAYIFADILRRSLEFLDYEVTQVVNITDVGHLTTDSDAGEDKMEKGARASNKTVWEVAKFYEEQFVTALDALNIKRPTHLPRATEHITEQIKLIQKLTEKGFTYETSDGIYFDTSKFPNYGKLSGQKLEDKEAGARVAVKSEKKHPADFALWKFCVGENADHVMRWTNPGGTGEGFPGWHIECSAMSSEYLGETFDIHTGGIDHVPVHHENEIAQSEAANSKPLVKYWLHNEFLTVDGGRMGKSLGNLYTLKDLRAKGFSPLAFRYLCLGTHYRNKLNFTWEALAGAANALKKLHTVFQEISKNCHPERSEPASAAEGSLEIKKFSAAISDDLNTPQALAIVWEVVKDESLPRSARAETLAKFDKILGLQLDQPIKESKVEPTAKQVKLLAEREKARQNKDFKRSDEIRAEFEKMGLEIEDTADGQVVKKI